MRKKVLYIKTPKTASSSIVVWLQQNCNVQIFMEPLVGGTRMPRKSSEHKIAWNTIINQTQYYDIKLLSVRNPFTRAVSAYRWLLKNSDRTKGLSWIKNADDHVLGFKSYLKKSLDVLREEDYFTWLICLPVYDYGRLDTFSYDYIIKYENLMKNLHEVRNKFFLGAGPICKNIPRLEYLGEYNFLDFYDEENKNLVIERYEKDFKFFSYKELLPVDKETF